MKAGSENKEFHGSSGSQQRSAHGALKQRRLESNRSFGKTEHAGCGYDRVSGEESFSRRLFLRTFAPIFLVVSCPMFVTLLWYTAARCGGSFALLLQEFTRRGCFVVLTEILTNINFRNPYVYGLLLLYIALQVLLMTFVPGKTFYGPLTPKGNQPVYKDNGFYCYLATLTIFAGIELSLRSFTPYSVTVIYDHFDQFLTSLNILSLVLCLLLCIKGHYHPSTTDSGSSGNIFFNYYWGTELYPRVFGIDVKVFTNCRFGMTVWSLLVITFALKNYQLNGFVAGVWTSTALQSIYFAKFFWWESGYMSTIDIMVDRAGFYICWGCLVFIPGLYASVSLYLATRTESLSNFNSLVVLIVGLSCCFINYWADMQKQIARRTGGKCIIWGKPAGVIEAEYVVGTEKKTSTLLVTGFWGISRHFHYLPELILALCWSIPCGLRHAMPYSYFAFLFVLLVHRTFRDDEKCRKKYGEFWTEYCRRVPYKILPYVF